MMHASFECSLGAAPHPAASLLPPCWLQVGTLLGGTAAVAFLPASAAAVVACGAAGAAVGVLAHVATAPKPQD